MGKLEDYTIDQMAGSAALVIGSIGALLTVIWQSRCHCRLNLCYLFQCERKPPPEADESAPPDVEAEPGAEAAEEGPRPEIEPEIAARP
jgi:hypothetical protein